MEKNLNYLYVQQNIRKRQIIPEKITKGVVVRAWKRKHFPVARKWAAKVYSDHKLAPDTVRIHYINWRITFFIFSSNFIQGINFIWWSNKWDQTNLEQFPVRITGCAISRKVVILVREGVLASKCLKNLLKMEEGLRHLSNKPITY